LRAIEEALSGAPASPPAGPPPSRRRDAAAPAVGTTAFLDRVQKARPIIGSYLANAKSNRREGDKLTFTFSDAFTVAAVRDARGGRGARLRSPRLRGHDRGRGRRRQAVREGRAAAPRRPRDQVLPEAPRRRSRGVAQALGDRMNPKKMMQQVQQMQAQMQAQ